MSARARAAAANLALAVLSLALFWVALELTLRALGPWLPLEQGRDVAFVNPNDPEREALALGPAAAEALADSVVYHIRSNQLTAPDPELLFRVRPNPGGAPVFGYTGINAQGFRSRPLQRDEGSRGIVLVSDSCGFGFGVRDHRRTLGFQLEQRLNRAGERYAVYNLSQPGYSSAQARRLLERWLPALEPDFVILYLGWNDLWAARGWSDDAALQALSWTRAGPLRAITGSRVWTALRAAYRALLRPEPAAELPALGGSSRRVGLAAALAHHRAMLEATRASGAALLVVPPPFYAGERERLGAMDEYAEALRAALEGEAVLVSLEALRAPTPRARSFFQADGYHLNPRGSRLVADELAARIRELESPAQPRAL